MDPLDYVKYLLALLIVLGLIGLIAYVLRRVGYIPTADRPKQARKRLGISQMMAIDGKRRLVLLRRDDQEHLVLLGPDGDTVIESNIPALRKVSAPAPQTQDEEEGDGTAGETNGHKEPRFPRFQLKPSQDEERS